MGAGTPTRGFILLLYVCMFLLNSQSLPSFFAFGNRVQKSVISPPRHIKQSLVLTTVSFVFPLWLRSYFSAGQQINTDLGDKRAKKVFLSYYYFKLHHFLSSRLILFFPLLFSSCSLSLFTPRSIYTAFTKQNWLIWGYETLLLNFIVSFILRKVNILINFPSHLNVLSFRDNNCNKTNYCHPAATNAAYTNLGLCLKNPV